MFLFSIFLLHRGQNSQNLFRQICKILITFRWIWEPITHKKVFFYLHCRLHQSLTNNIHLKILLVLKISRYKSLEFWKVSKSGLRSFVDPLAPRFNHGHFLKLRKIIILKSLLNWVFVTVRATMKTSSAKTELSTQQVKPFKLAQIHFSILVNKQILRNTLALFWPAVVT